MSSNPGTSPTINIRVRATAENLRTVMGETIAYANEINKAFGTEVKVSAEVAESTEVLTRGMRGLNRAENDNRHVTMAVVDGLGIFGNELGHLASKAYYLKEGVSELTKQFGGLRGAILPGLGISLGFQLLAMIPRMVEGVEAVQKAKIRMSEAGKYYASAFGGNAAQWNEAGNKAAEAFSKAFLQYGVTRPIAQDIIAQGMQHGIQLPDIVAHQATIVDVSKRLAGTDMGTPQAVMEKLTSGQRGLNAIMREAGLKLLPTETAALQKTTNATTQFDLAMTILARHFSGYAAENAKTFAGAMANLHAIMNEFYERAGVPVVNVLTWIVQRLINLATAANWVAGVFSKFPKLGWAAFFVAGAVGMAYLLRIVLAGSAKIRASLIKTFTGLPGMGKLFKPPSDDEIARGAKGWNKLTGTPIPKGLKQQILNQQAEVSVKRAAGSMSGAELERLVKWLHLFPDGLVKSATLKLTLPDPKSLPPKAQLEALVAALQGDDLTRHLTLTMNVPDPEMMRAAADLGRQMVNLAAIADVTRDLKLTLEQPPLDEVKTATAFGNVFSKISSGVKTAGIKLEFPGGSAAQFKELLTDLKALRGIKALGTTVTFDAKDATIAKDNYKNNLRSLFDLNKAEGGKLQTVVSILVPVEAPEALDRLRNALVGLPDLMRAALEPIAALAAALREIAREWVITLRVQGADLGALRATLADLGAASGTVTVGGGPAAAGPEAEPRSGSWLERLRTRFFGRGVTSTAAAEAAAAAGEPPAEEVTPTAAAAPAPEAAAAPEVTPALEAAAAPLPEPVPYVGGPIVTQPYIPLPPTGFQRISKQPPPRSTLEAEEELRRLSGEHTTLQQTRAGLEGSVTAGAPRIAALARLRKRTPEEHQELSDLLGQQESYNQAIGDVRARGESMRALMAQHGWDSAAAERVLAGQAPHPEGAPTPLPVSYAQVAKEGLGGGTFYRGRYTRETFLPTTPGESEPGSSFLEAGMQGRPPSGVDAAKMPRADLIKRIDDAVALITQYQEVRAQADALIASGEVTGKAADKLKLQANKPLPSIPVETPGTPLSLAALDPEKTGLPGALRDIQDAALEAMPAKGQQVPPQLLSKGRISALAGPMGLTLEQAHAQARAGTLPPVFRAPKGAGLLTTDVAHAYRTALAESKLGPVMNITTEHQTMPAQSGDVKRELSQARASISTLEELRRQPFLQQSDAILAHIQQQLDGYAHFAEGRAQELARLTGDWSERAEQWKAAAEVEQRAASALPPVPTASLLGGTTAVPGGILTPTAATQMAQEARSAPAAEWQQQRDRLADQLGELRPHQAAYRTVQEQLGIGQALVDKKQLVDQDLAPLKEEEGKLRELLHELLAAKAELEARLAGLPADMGAVEAPPVGEPMRTTLAEQETPFPKMVTKEVTAPPNAYASLPPVQPTEPGAAWVPTTKHLTRMRQVVATRFGQLPEAMQRLMRAQGMQITMHPGENLSEAVTAGTLPLPEGETIGSLQGEGGGTPKAGLTYTSGENAGRIHLMSRTSAAVQTEEFMHALDVAMGEAMGGGLASERPEVQQAYAASGATPSRPLGEAALKNPREYFAQSLQRYHSGEAGRRALHQTDFAAYQMAQRQTELAEQLVNQGAAPLEAPPPGELITGPTPTEPVKPPPIPPHPRAIYANQGLDRDARYMAQRFFSEQGTPDYLPDVFGQGGKTKFTYKELWAELKKRVKTLPSGEKPTMKRLKDVYAQMQGGLGSGPAVVTHGPVSSDYALVGNTQDRAKQRIGKLSERLDPYDEAARKWEEQYGTGATEPTEPEKPAKTPAKKTVKRRAKKTIATETGTETGTETDTEPAEKPAQKPTQGAPVPRPQEAAPLVMTVEEADAEFKKLDSNIKGWTTKLNKVNQAVARLVKAEEALAASLTQEAGVYTNAVHDYEEAQAALIAELGTAAAKVPVPTAAEAEDRIRQVQEAREDQLGGHKTKEPPPFGPTQRASIEVVTAPVVAQIQRQTKRREQVRIAGKEALKRRESDEAEAAYQQVQQAGSAAVKATPAAQTPEGAPGAGLSYGSGGLTRARGDITTGTGKAALFAVERISESVSEGLATKPGPGSALHVFGPVNATQTAFDTLAKQVTTLHAAATHPGLAQVPEEMHLAARTSIREVNALEAALQEVRERTEEHLGLGINTTGANAAIDHLLRQLVRMRELLASIPVSGAAGAAAPPTPTETVAGALSGTVVPPVGGRGAVAPEATQALHRIATANAAGSLEDLRAATAGWKMHLAAPEAHRDAVEDELRAMQQRGQIAFYKRGRAGDQEGKDFTVYAGAAERAQAAAEHIEQSIGQHLEAPHGETLTDDRPLTPHVMGRFDIGTVDPRFHQYGAAGIPYLNEDVGQVGVMPEAERPAAQAQARARAHATLQRDYRSFYEAPPREEPPASAATPAVPPSVPPAPPTAVGEALPIESEASFNVEGNSAAAADAWLAKLHEIMLAHDLVTKAELDYVSSRGLDNARFWARQLSELPRDIITRVWLELQPVMPPLVMTGGKKGGKLGIEPIRGGIIHEKVEVDGTLPKEGDIVHAQEHVTVTGDKLPVGGKVETTDHVVRTGDPIPLGGKVETKDNVTRTGDPIPVEGDVETKEHVTRIGDPIPVGGNINVDEKVTVTGADHPREVRITERVVRVIGGLKDRVNEYTGGFGMGLFMVNSMIADSLVSGIPWGKMWNAAFPGTKEPKLPKVRSLEDDFNTHLNKLYNATNHPAWTKDGIKIQGSADYTGGSRPTISQAFIRQHATPEQLLAGARGARADLIKDAKKAGLGDISRFEADIPTMAQLRKQKDHGAAYIQSLRKSGYVPTTTEDTIIKQRETAYKAYLAQATTAEQPTQVMTSMGLMQNPPSIDARRALAQHQDAWSTFVKSHPGAMLPGKDPRGVFAQAPQTPATPKPSGLLVDIGNWMSGVGAIAQGVWQGMGKMNWGEVGKQIGAMVAAQLILAPLMTVLEVTILRAFRVGFSKMWGGFRGGGAAAADAGPTALKDLPRAARAAASKRMAYLKAQEAAGNLTDDEATQLAEFESDDFTSMKPKRKGKGKGKGKGTPKPPKEGKTTLEDITRDQNEDAREKAWGRVKKLRADKDAGVKLTPEQEQILVDTHAGNYDFASKDKTALARFNARVAARAGAGGIATAAPGTAAPSPDTVPGTTPVKISSATVSPVRDSPAVHAAKERAVATKTAYDQALSHLSEKGGEDRLNKARTAMQDAYQAAGKDWTADVRDPVYRLRTKATVKANPRRSVAYQEARAAAVEGEISTLGKPQQAIVRARIAQLRAKPPKTLTSYQAAELKALDSGSIEPILDTLKIPVTPATKAAITAATTPPVPAYQTTDAFKKLSPAQQAEVEAYVKRWTTGKLPKGAQAASRAASAELARIRSGDFSQFTKPIRGAGTALPTQPPDTAPLEIPPTAVESPRALSRFLRALKIGGKLLGPAATLYTAWQGYQPAYEAWKTANPKGNFLQFMMHQGSQFYVNPRNRKTYTIAAGGKVPRGWKPVQWDPSLLGLGGSYQPYYNDSAGNQIGVGTPEESAFSRLGAFRSRSSHMPGYASDVAPFFGPHVRSGGGNEDMPPTWYQLPGAKARLTGDMIDDYGNLLPQFDTPAWRRKLGLPPLAHPASRTRSRRARSHPPVHRPGRPHHPQRPATPRAAAITGVPASITIQTPDGPATLRDPNLLRLYHQASVESGMPMAAIVASGYKESGWQTGIVQKLPPGTPESQRGYGVAQFTGDTGAYYLGGKGWQQRALDPSLAIPAAGRMFKDLLRQNHGNVKAALAAYNAGNAASPGGQRYATSVLNMASTATGAGQLPVAPPGSGKTQPPLIGPQTQQVPIKIKVGPVTFDASAMKAALHYVDTHFKGALRAQLESAVHKAFGDTNWKPGAAAARSHANAATSSLAASSGQNLQQKTSTAFSNAILSSFFGIPFDKGQQSAQGPGKTSTTTLAGVVGTNFTRKSSTALNKATFTSFAGIPWDTAQSRTQPGGKKATQHLATAIGDHLHDKARPALNNATRQSFIQIDWTKPTNQTITLADPPITTAAQTIGDNWSTKVHSAFTTGPLWVQIAADVVNTISGMLNTIWSTVGGIIGSIFGHKKRPDAPVHFHWGKDGKLQPDPVPVAPPPPVHHPAAHPTHRVYTPAMLADLARRTVARDTAKHFSAARIEADVVRTLQQADRNANLIASNVVNNHGNVHTYAPGSHSPTNVHIDNVTVHTTSAHPHDIYVEFMSKTIAGVRGRAGGR